MLTTICIGFTISFCLCVGAEELYTTNNLTTFLMVSREA